MIRVLNILDTVSSGGVERRRLSLAKLLDKSKFELKIICTNAVGLLPDEIRKNGVEIIEIGDLKSFADFKQHQKVMKIIDEFKPHIIHGAVFEGVTMAALNGFLKRVPIVILEETSDPKNRRWKGNLLMRLLTLTADKVIGVSPAATDYLKNKLSISAGKVILINNGVVMPRKVSKEEIMALKRGYQIEYDEIVIGSVGRMLQDEHKRFSDLIKAFSIVIQSGIKAKLLLVGQGPEMEKYKELAKTLKLEDKIIFAGYQADTALFYSVFEIFSLVSAYEAFGLVLPEAMLHKLPVVATRVGGMQFIVDDIQTGFLVEKFNVEEIAEKLKQLCLDKALRIQQGNKGYQKAMTAYTEERYVKEVETLYLELVNKKGIKLS